MKSLQLLRDIALSLVLFVTPFALARPGAGGLPYCYDRQGRLMFLIGQEPNGEWSDFGGSADQGDKTVLDTAAREFTEETRYVFGKKALGLKHLCNHAPEGRQKQASIKYLKNNVKMTMSHPNGGYVMHLVKVRYIHDWVFGKAKTVPHYEKKDYAWVNAHLLLKAITGTPRGSTVCLGNKQLRGCLVGVLRAHEQKIRQVFGKSVR